MVLKKKMVAALFLPSLFLGVNTIGQDPAEAASREGVVKKNVSFRDEGYVSALSKYINAATTATAPSSSSSETAMKVIAAGKKYMGTPYKFGSDRSTTTTFDCSDFVRQAYKEGAGIILPRNSRTQATYVEKIGETTTNWRDLKPGDILFFMSYKGTSPSNYAKLNKSAQRITHNGIYLGNGKILHTYSNKSGGVRIDSIAGKHWEHRFVFGGSAMK